MYRPRILEEPDINMTINERILKLRKQKNLTQQQLADGIGYGRGQVAKWEKKLADPSIEHVIALADFFKVSCDYLLRGYENADLPLGRKLNLPQDALDGLADLTDPDEVGGKALAYFIGEIPKIDDIGSYLQDAVRLIADTYRYIDSDYEDEDLGTLKLNDGSRIEKNLVVSGIVHAISSVFESALYDGIRMEAGEYAKKKDNP